MRVAFTDHALRRYIERVRPTLSRTSAREELAAVLRLAEIREDFPPFRANSTEADGYAMLGEDVCFPCKRRSNGWMALTCITSDTHSEWWRAKRNRRKAVLRHAKQTRNSQEHRHGQRRDPEPFDPRPFA